ncbi:MAG TPA: spore germination protein GerW family protein [Ruminiclostridium sp.]|nr:spore germination protein GerW family protein [Ruminiclostridium sp.]
MDPNMNQNVTTLFSNLEDFTQNEGLIGKPVTHGDKTFIPVVSVTLGYGTGNTASKNQGSSAQSQPSSTTSGMANNMAGGALGLGAKLCTDAIIVIDKDNISMMQVGPTTTSQLMEKIPQIISGIGSMGKQQSQPQSSQAQSSQT